MAQQDISGSLFFGSLIMAVSGFFPWVTIGSTTLSGFDSHTAALWVLVFAVVAALLSWRVRDNRTTKKSKSWISGTGWFGLGIGGIGYAIPERLYDFGGRDASPFLVDLEVSGEAGLLVAAIGGVTLIVSAARIQAQDPQPSSRGDRAVQTSAVTSSTETDTRICPRCAESVKAAAKVCRYCGYEFPTEITEPDLAQGEVVSDVKVHAFGVEWGKTASGRTVYRELGGDEWLVYEPGSTSLVPPSGYDG